MRANRNLVTILFAAAIAFASVGAQALDFAAGAPGTPTQNTTNIQNAITSALATAGPNRVLLQSNQTYVVDARLLVSGAAKSVTVTSDGAGKAILVGPNYTTTANSFEGVFTVQTYTNGSLGFENFTLLPPPFSTVGSGPAVGNTNGIGIADTCTGSNFHFVNMLITGNNNANAPVSTNGTGALGANDTVFGGANVNVPHGAAVGALANNFFLTGVVSSHVNNEAFRVSGSLVVATTTTTDNRFVASGCIFGHSLLANLLHVSGLNSVTVTNSQVVGAVPADALHIEGVYTAAVRGFVASGMVGNGIELFNVRTASVRDATITNSLATSTTVAVMTMLIVNNDATFRTLQPTVNLTDVYIGDTAALIHAVHMYFQRFATLTRVTVKNLTLATPVNPPILLGMMFENCNEVTLDGCIIQNILNPTTASLAIDFTFTGLTNPASQSAPKVQERRFTMRNCRIKDVIFGIFPRTHYDGLIENCVFENFDLHVISERTNFGRSNNPASVNWGRRSLTVRDCTMTNIENHVLNPTNVTTSYINGFDLLDDYVTFERVVLTGPTTPVANVGNAVHITDPLRATFTNCFFAGWNRGAVWCQDGDTPNTLVNPAMLSVALYKVENSYLYNCGNNNGAPITDQSNANGNFIYAPIAFDQGHRFECRNTIIENNGGDAVHMLFVSGGGLACPTATASITDCTFVNCRDNLVVVECGAAQQNVVDINGIYTSGNPRAQTAGGLTPALDLQTASATVRNVSVSGWAGPVLENRFSGAPTPGSYTIEDVRISNVGQNAIQMDNSWDGSMIVNRATIRGVTAGSGISVQGGSIAGMDRVEVVNAARYGISVGETAPAPLVGPIYVTGPLTHLCLMNNGLGGVRFVYGDRTKPPMALFNSTILGSPVGISYEHLDGQVLQLHDSIIAGQPAAGDVGVDVVGTVVGVGSPAPRVQVSYSALVTDNVNNRALSNAVRVAGGNPGGTVTQSNVIGSDPIFVSTVPGNPGFMDVDSSYFGNKGTGGVPLAGCADYIGGTVGIAHWRLY